MMLSPAEYLREEFGNIPKGVPLSVYMMRKIRRLKNTIGHIKKEMEHPCFLWDFVCPSKDVQLKMHREYLRAAIELYEAMVGPYQPTKAELLLKEVDASLEEMQSISLEIWVKGEEAEPKCFTIKRGDALQDPKGVLFEHPYTFDKFINDLKELHLGEWKPSYTLTPFGMKSLRPVLWTLTIRYSTSRPPFVRRGNSAYPYNFGELACLLGAKGWSRAYPDHISMGEVDWWKLEEILHLSMIETPPRMLDEVRVRRTGK